MKRTVLQRLRTIGTFEGISFILLLGIAMPLKYMAGKPLAVTITGMIHGGLFLLYCAALAHAMKVLGRPLRWSVKLFIAALLPFGPFVMDRGLKREMETVDTHHERIS